MCKDQQMRTTIDDEEMQQQAIEGEETQEQHATTTVEFATLLLPSHAIDEGMTSGEGDQVILQARSVIVENFIENKGTETSAVEDPTPTMQIQAVVDLEVLSELVGLPEDEFVEGLHQEVYEQQQISSEETPDSDGIALQNVDKHGSTEHTPLIPSSKHHRVPTSENIILSADPFVETLADVLPTSNVTESKDGTTTTTEAASTITTGQQQQQHQHLAHDAFLLELPHEPGDDGDEHHFVLAMPEIQVAEDAKEAATPSSEAPFKSLAERAFSFLPTDVEQIHMEATTVPVETYKKIDEETKAIQLDLIVERKAPVIGYVILVTGLVALSSVGTALELQGGGVSPLMKTFWRNFSTTLCLFPFALRSFRRDGWPQLTTKQIMMFLICAASYAFMNAAFVVSLTMTTLTHAVVFSNLTPLVIIGGKAVMGLPILILEGMGTTIGLLGGAVCAGDTSSSENDASSINNPYEYIGDLFGLLSSFGVAVYLVIAKKLRPSVDLFVFMFILFVLSTIFLLLYMVVSGETVTFSNHSVHGIFGWTNLTPDRLPLELYMALVCNLLGTTGYIAVMKYFDPIVVSTVMLLEPVVAALLGAAFGTDPLPNKQTWFGDILVATGSFLVIWSEARKSETIDATEALRPKVGDDTVVVAKSPVVSKARLDATKSLMKSPVRKRTDADDYVRVVWE